MAAGFRIGWVSGTKSFMRIFNYDQQANVMHCSTITQVRIGHSFVPVAFNLRFDKSSTYSVTRQKEGMGTPDTQIVNS